MYQTVSPVGRDESPLLIHSERSEESRVQKSLRFDDMPGSFGKPQDERRVAFTLAEVLITLGIIGVVAAMTLPTLIQTYKKRVVETRLQKVYSVMNQAITSSTVDNGETETWEGIANSSATHEDTLAWFNKYLAPYLKYTEVKQENGAENLLVYLPDGTALRIKKNIYDIVYIVNPKSEYVKTL